MTVYKKINLKKVPNHVAIIMDGNGRWAKEQGKSRSFGHLKGVKVVKEIVEATIKLNIKHLTLFAFSKENWKRPKTEIGTLMNLFVSTIRKNKNHFLNQKIRINTIGDMADLPKKCQIAINEMMELTKHNNTLVLTLALSYSSRFEILNAFNNMISLIQQNNITHITKDLFENNLQTCNLPDPELLIRTSGEKRISNFLLWQIAFSELYFSEKKWPDFDEEELYMAIFEYQKRERRFGKTTEQISNEDY